MRGLAGAVERQLVLGESRLEAEEEPAPWEEQGGRGKQAQDNKADKAARKRVPEEPPPKAGPLVRQATQAQGKAEQQEPPPGPPRLAKAVPQPALAPAPAREGRRQGVPRAEEEAWAGPDRPGHRLRAAAKQGQPAKVAMGVEAKGEATLGKGMIRAQPNLSISIVIPNAERSMLDVQPWGAMEKQILPILSTSRKF